ncbi:hypothetical protein CPB83DRAFT_907188 [Crepidotus variabilis]|uniref:DUF6534 domain-containing protein n=1 Tax=Crepidotus variabilis TaxID=179855 RepID=A0A9P6EFA4_9AGAR|nr:hypothetical protein CPB83DRAFT_907188 [Crepidotus variabilis]
MAVPATLDPSQPLHSTMGAMFLGVVVSGILHGLCILQAFKYFRKFPDDPWYVKATVITTMSFDAFHQMLITIGVYHYVIAQFHHPDSLEFMTWSILLEGLFPATNGGLVQIYYLFRVWRLSKRNWLLCGFIALLIMGEVGGGMTWVVLSMQMKTFRQLLTISPLTISINALSTSADMTIALSLCVMLHRARTGFKRSDNIINKLIVFVVNTGMITTAFAVSALVCLIVSPHTLTYAFFYFCIGRLYTNSFLATLNTRQSTSATSTDRAELSLNSLTPGASRSKNISIRIETTQELQAEKTYNSHMRSKGDYSDDTVEIDQDVVA